MKRAPVVLAGTALGVAGVVGFHASGSSSAVASGQSATTTQSATTASSGSTTSGSSTPVSTTTASSSSTSSTTASTSSATKTRSAVGSDVPYQFGDLQVKVTATGSKITDISIVQANVTDPHSASIDQYAIPQLRSEALSAQSAKIAGVSGASYTSAAYEQSLQSALDKLKI